MPSRIIFLTGATGKIGRPLLKIIAGGDYNIVSLIRRGEIPGISGPNIRYLFGDIADTASYESSLSGVDTVVHMAAVTHTNDTDEYHRLNAAATLDLIRACRVRGVKRFIFISTRAISPSGGGYSRSKIAAEQYVKESALDWVILRLAEVYGIEGNTGVDMVLRDIERLLFLPVIGRGDYKIAPIYVSDVVLTIARVIGDDSIKHKIYNLAGPESYTVNEFIDAVSKIKNIKRIKIHIPVFLISICAPILSIFLKDHSFVSDQLQRLLCDKSDDISLAAKELDFRPITLEKYLQNKVA